MQTRVNAVYLAVVFELQYPVRYWRSECLQYMIAGGRFGASKHAAAAVDVFLLTHRGGAWAAGRYASAARIFSDGDSAGNHDRVA